MSDIFRKKFPGVLKFLRILSELDGNSPDHMVSVFIQKK